METCKKHPKYTGKKLPRNWCPRCLTLYIKMGKLTRKPTAPPSQVHKSKKTYTRKKKHRGRDEE